MRYGLIDPAESSFEDRTCFPAQSSVLDEIALSHRILSQYNIPEVKSCKFHTRGDGDVYRVQTAGPDFYLKIYRPPYSLPEVEAEGQFVCDLAKNGIPIVEAVETESGNFAIGINASEGTRPILLFHEAPPPIETPLSNEKCLELGTALARFHYVADSLAKKYEREVFDCEYVINNMLNYSRDFLSTEDFDFLHKTAGKISNNLENLPRSGSGFGICHTDLVGSNIRFSLENGFTLFDFGAAAYTFRSYELTVLYLEFKRSTENREKAWESFLDGYSAVRTLPDGLDDHLLDLCNLRRISWISGNAATLQLRLGISVYEDGFLQNAVKLIRESGS